MRQWHLNGVIFQQPLLLCSILQMFRDEYTKPLESRYFLIGVGSVWFLTQCASNLEASRTNVSVETPCTWRPWLVCTAPGPPQESLVCDEARISLPAKPSLTRTTLGQLCVAPQASWLRLVATGPGRKPRVSGGTASAVMQCPRPLRHPGGPHLVFYEQITPLPKSTLYLKRSTILCPSRDSLYGMVVCAQ